MAEEKVGEFSNPPGAGNVSTGHTEAVLDVPKAATLTSMSDVPESVKAAAMGEDEVESSREAIAKELDSEVPDFSRFCPMCAWDQEKRDIIEITDEDKRDFVFAALSNGRFKKVYPKLGGKFKITMRSRMAAETDMLTEQLARDQKRESIDAAYILQLKSMHYQMLLGVEAIETETEGTTFPEISTDMPPAEPPEGEERQLTPLEIADRDIAKEWNEITYSMVQNTARHFEQVIQHLVIRSNDPDFWEGIATQD